MNKSSGTKKRKRGHLRLPNSLERVISSFQHDIANTIRLKGQFDCEEPWYQGYRQELLARGLRPAEISNIEDIAVATAKNGSQLSYL